MAAGVVHCVTSRRLPRLDNASRGFCWMEAILLEEHRPRRVRGMPEQKRLAPEGPRYDEVSGGKELPYLQSYAGHPFCTNAAMEQQIRFEFLSFKTCNRTMSLQAPWSPCEEARLGTVFVGPPFSGGRVSVSGWRRWTLTRAAGAPGLG